MIVKCTRCGFGRERIWTGRRTNSGAKVNRDGSWKRWNGLVCPDCVGSVTGVSDGLGLLAPEAFVQDPITHRLCRSCRKPLPASRYYMHVNCRPIVDYRDMSTEYLAHYGR